MSAADFHYPMPRGLWESEYLRIHRSPFKSAQRQFALLGCTSSKYKIVEPDLSSCVIEIDLAGPLTLSPCSLGAMRSWLAAVEGGLSPETIDVSSLDK